MADAPGDPIGHLEALRRLLVRVRYPRPVDPHKLLAGVTDEALPILQYALLSYSHRVSALLAERGVELLGKSLGPRFLEQAFKALRTCLDYQPALTMSQMLSPGFAERKLLLLSRVLQLVIDKDAALAPKESARAPRARAAPPAAAAAAAAAARRPASAPRSTDANSPRAPELAARVEALRRERAALNDELDAMKQQVDGLATLARDAARDMASASAAAAKPAARRAPSPAASPPPPPPVHATLPPPPKSHSHSQAPPARRGGADALSAAEKEEASEDAAAARAVSESLNAAATLMMQKLEAMQRALYGAMDRLQARLVVVEGQMRSMQATARHAHSAAADDSAAAASDEQPLRARRGRSGGSGGDAVGARWRRAAPQASPSTLSAAPSVAAEAGSPAAPSSARGAESSDAFVAEMRGRLQQTSAFLRSLEQESGE